MRPPKLRWVIYTAFIAFLVSVMLVSFFKEIRRVEMLSKKLDERMAERIAVERDSQELKRKIEYYSTPEGIARLAREQFNLVHSGEVLYKIEIVSPDGELKVTEQN